MERSRVFEAVLVILALALACLLYIAIASAPPDIVAWEVAGNDTVEYMLVGSNDTLYTFNGYNGNNITAIKSDGSVLWTLSVPRQWTVLDSLTAPTFEAYKNPRDAREWIFTPIVDEHDGYLYLYLISSGEKNPEAGYESIVYETVVMAIAPNGTISWVHKMQFGDLFSQNTLQPISGSMRYVVVIKATGDRVYLFHNYKVDVLDGNGKPLFSLQDVAAPVCVDSDGRIYAVRLTAVTTETLQAMLDNSTLVSGNLYATAHNWGGEWIINGNLESNVLPSGIVDAYAPDGTLLWSRDIGEGAVWQPLSAVMWQSYNTLPLYVNDTLYVPLYDGVAALDTEGNTRWISHINDGPYRLFELMPIDGQGDVYMQQTGNEKDSVIRVIDSNGSLLASRWNITNDPAGIYNQSYPGPLAGKGGIVYAIPAYPPVNMSSFNDTVGTLRYGLDTIEAVDVKDNRTLWQFTIPDADKHVTTLNRDKQNTAPLTPVISKKIQVYPGDGVTYVNYQFSMYETPVINNLSRRIDARGLYALDGEGKLLWEKPGGPVSLAVVDNRTLYYVDGNRLGGRTVGVTAGFALAAFAYLFLRFFMLGTVTRARSRLEQNENRNAVLRYVADNPGATAADVVKGLGMNTGTIRYHLFILTLNHKIATHKEDDKYLRYFRNAGAYTETERSLVSLLRREPLRRTLEAIARNPGLSGSGLARELNLSATAANRHVATLANKGIIEQVPVPEKGYGYVIKAEHREMIGRLMNRI
jgi:predicted transcriptional regulator